LSQPRSVDSVMPYLLIIPRSFPHFAGFTAGPVALTAGGALGRLIALVHARPAQIAVGAVAAGALLAYASGWAGVTFNSRLPDQFRELTADSPGCITSDDPTALVATDTLSRNLSRGCQFIADFGGHSHDMAAAAGVLCRATTIRPANNSRWITCAVGR
jgi:alpha-1,2-mannosyltransferase